MMLKPVAFFVDKKLKKIIFTDRRFFYDYITTLEKKTVTTPSAIYVKKNFVLLFFKIYDKTFNFA